MSVADHILALHPLATSCCCLHAFRDPSILFDITDRQYTRSPLLDRLGKLLDHTYIGYLTHDIDAALLPRLLWSFPVTPTALVSEEERGGGEQETAKDVSSAAACAEG